MSDTPETNSEIILKQQIRSSKDAECSRFVRYYFACKLERERDESNAKLQRISSELQMWRDGNILHENHRDELDRLKRERDEAREYWGTESMNAAEFFSQKTKAIAERDEAKEEIDSLKKGEHLLFSQRKLAEVIRERDEALKQNAKLLEITERLADDICDFHSCFRRNLDEFYEIKEEMTIEEGAK